MWGKKEKGNENIERGEKKGKEKGKGKEVQHLLVSSVQTSRRFDGSGSELDYALKGRGSLLLWLVLIEGPFDDHEV